MKKELFTITYQKKEIEAILQKWFSDKAKVGNVFLLSGPLGAGKTFFVKSFLRFFYKFDDVCSPTFTKVNEYQIAKTLKAYHSDFYAFKDENIDLEEILMQKDAMFFIEWPSLHNLHPSVLVEHQVYEIDLSYDFDNPLEFEARVMTCRKVSGY